MQQSITSIVESVLHELEAHGLTRTTIHQYQRGYFRPIIRYFTENSGGMYNSETLESCLARYQNALNSGEIKRHHYQSMNRALHCIRTYAETGDVTFTRIVNTKSFVPSVEAHAVIKSALARTSLKDEFKYKLDCILRKFFCFIENKDLDTSSITAGLIREFINHAHSSNTGSMEYVTYSLKVLMDYLRSENIVDFHFDFCYFTPKSRPKKIIAAFSKQEVAKILSQIDTSTPLGKRNYAIILLACGTGLRGIDIVKLKLSDINWKTGEINIVQSKTRNPITLSLSGQIRNAIADYILNGRQKADSKNVFLRDSAPFVRLKGASALDGIIDNICIKAGVAKQPYRSFHSLRRSFGTWMAHEEVPITTIFQLLGHKKMDSSKPYLSFNDRQMLECALGFEDIPLKGGVYA